MTNTEKLFLKEVSRQEFQQMLSDYGHHLNVTVAVLDEHGVTQQRCVLNNAVVYNPYGKRLSQIGMSSNEQNAETALRFIKRNATVYSAVFPFCSGEYVIY